MELSPKRERAAALVAEDRLTDAQIADELGIAKRTLEYWKRDAAFSARVEVRARALSDAIARRGIAERQNRVDALNDVWQRMLGVIQDRASDPTMADLSGAKRGILVRTYKQLGGGETATTVEEYHTDRALLIEIREYAKQAAQELGQWVEKGELTGKDGSPLQAPIVYIPDNGRA